MSGTRFEVSVKVAEWSASGADEIEFLVSPNRGEELRPMGKIASGGELSRISLALKTAIGDAGSSGDVHTLVFDEVDAGVGGAAAASVGKRLKILSATNQVICVTHLAQIAGFADHHYAVSKSEKNGRVAAGVEELDKKERTREIARMLSGETVTAEALKHAEQLMRRGDCKHFTKESLTLTGSESPFTPARHVSKFRVIRRYRAGMCRIGKLRRTCQVTGRREAAGVRFPSASSLHNQAPRRRMRLSIK